jgi:hypothetical protein
MLALVGMVTLRVGSGQVLLRGGDVVLGTHSLGWCGGAGAVVEAVLVG